MVKRSTVRINRDLQLPLIGIEHSPQYRLSNQARPSKRAFEQPDPDTIFIGQASLKHHLEAAKIKAPLVMRKFLQTLDWSSLESLYAKSGRPPYAPVAMMGPILYGIHNGITSLRRLERFARTDLGCMWVTGGIAPDHSVIGKFIYRHQEQITTELFTNITRSVLNHTGSDASSVAGDGTIIEAACSHYNLLKQEAVTQALECAHQEASNNPEDTNAQARLALANKASDILQSRIEHNKSNYKKKENLRINPQEPDAVIQRPKRGIGVAPSYKPSILSNDRRIITAHAIHASSETAVGAQMLDQSEVINGVKTDELLLDAGYCCGSILNESIAREISLLCPEGRKLGKGKCSAKRYMKGDFEYNEELDTYKCPAGQILMLESTRKSNDGREYGTKACQSCVLREKCTTSKKGRKVIRYPHDEYKEALRTVMEQK